MMSTAISENIALASLRSIAGALGFIDDRRLVASASEVAAALQIKAGAIDQQPAKSLSGDNQQKVVIAKWLMSGPAIFILDEPTRGVDVGAKVEIYELIRELARKGTAILLISSELPEILHLADRILVMSKGRLSLPSARGERSIRELGELMAGHAAEMAA